MPRGTKRKASTASLSRPPSKKAKKSTAKYLDGDGDASPPALRRASTLPVEDDAGDKHTSRRKSSSKRSTASKPSLSRKPSSIVAEKGIVTSLEKLPSGSIVGESFTAASVSKSSSLSRSLSKKGSLSRASSAASSKSGSFKIPSVPSGLTKLAMPFGGSKASLPSAKSALIEPVDASEMSAALASLRSTSVSPPGSEPENEEPAPAPPQAGPSAAADVPLPPGGLLEVAISFDTTGSMYECLTEVRAKIQDLIQRLQADIPGIRIAIIAHGDYCDTDKYIIKWIDFGASLPETLDFVNSAGPTYGGDGPECYELVLKRAREALSWTPRSQRVLVVIGDDEPHPVGYTYGGITYDIDWRKESLDLRDMGVTIYGVQSGADHGCTKFMDEAAAITGGKRLTLANFSNIFDFLMMICYREGNPDMMPVYEAEVRGRGGMAKDMEDLVFAFGKDGPKAGKVTKGAAKRGPAKTKTPKAKGGKVTVEKGKVAAKKAAGAKKDVTKKPAAKTSKSKKATKKATKKSKKKRKPKKFFRESLPDAKMEVGPLKSLKWTDWVLVVNPSLPKGHSYKNWTSNIGFSYRRKFIFDENTMVPAIYEFAVRLPGGRKKYVLYYRKAGGFPSRKRWDTYLISRRTINAEIPFLMSAECQVFVRRGVLKAKKDAMLKFQKVISHIRKTMDYAWRTNTRGKKTNRRVVRNKIVLSGNQ